MHKFIIPGVNDQPQEPVTQSFKTLMPDDPVAESEEGGEPAPIIPGTNYYRSPLLDLSPWDLKRLRAKVREVLLAQGVPSGMITSYECDKYIESVLPVTAERMLKEAVDRKLGSL